MIERLVRRNPSGNILCAGGRRIGLWIFLEIQNYQKCDFFSFAGNDRASRKKESKR